MRRCGYYIQRSTSHILVLTAGEETIIIDTEGSFLRDLTGKESICIQIRKGTPAGEVVMTTVMVLFYQFMLKIIISTNSSIKTVQNISRASTTVWHTIGIDNRCLIVTAIKTAVS